jgi:hypothetical protein
MPYTGLTFRSIRAGFPKYRCSRQTPRVVWIISGPSHPGLEWRNLRVVKGLFWVLPKLGRVHKTWNLLNNTIGTAVNYATLHITQLLWSSCGLRLLWPHTDRFRIGPAWVSTNNARQRGTPRRHREQSHPERNTKYQQSSFSCPIELIMPFRLGVQPLIST